MKDLKQDGSPEIEKLEPKSQVQLEVLHHRLFSFEPYHALFFLIAAEKKVIEEESKG